MNTFFEVFCNPEFWIAVACAFVIALVIAYIAQDVWNTFWSLRYEEYLDEVLYPLYRPIEIGETLYDIHEDCEVVYIGRSDNGNHLVTYQEDSVVFVIETEIDNLRIINTEE
jgi:hypothetical protein